MNKLLRKLKKINVITMIGFIIIRSVIIIFVYQLMKIPAGYIGTMLNYFSFEIKI